VQRSGKPEVEVGVVHEDGEVGATRLDLPHHGAEDAPEVAQVPQDLEEAHDREIAHVDEEVRALGGEPVASEAGDLEAGDPGTQVTDELSGVEITRGLSTGDEESRRG